MFIEFLKIIDDEPVLIAAEQVARVHGRKDGKGRLFSEVYVIGGRKPIAVAARVDQVKALLAAAGVKTIGPGGEATAREGGYQPQGQQPLNPPALKPPTGGSAIERRATPAAEADRPRPARPSNDREAAGVKP